MQRERSGLLMVAGSALCFGSLAIFGKLAARRQIPLAELLALRFLGAALILWLLAGVRRERLWFGKGRGVSLSAMGLLYCAQATAYFSSLRTVPAAVTSILLYAYPVLVTLLAWILLGDRITALRAAALTAASAGVFLVVNPLGAGGSLDAGGVVFGLASAAIYATYIVAGPRLIHGAGALAATAYVSTVAGACFSIAALAVGLRPIGGGGVAVLAGIVVFATVIPAALFLAGLARVGPTRAAIVSTLEPATTVVLAAIVLGEDLGPVRLIGGALVLVAAALIARTGRPSLAEPQVRE